MLLAEMRAFLNVILVSAVFVLAGCSSNNDNAHTTATTIVPPPVRQQLHVEVRPASQDAAALQVAPASQVAAKADHQDPAFNPRNPFLVFNFTNGQTFKESDPVVIDFSLANAKLKNDGGDYRVRYIVDDEEMQWIDSLEQVVLSGWTPGKHTIRLELVGPDGWPYKNGDYNVAVREFAITK
jgi:hypothetical protein